MSGERRSFSSGQDVWESGDRYWISNPPGMPRPLLDGRPVAWAEYPLDEREGDHLVAWDDDHHVYPEEVELQDPARLYEAFYERLCVLCGERLGDPVFFFADEEANGPTRPRPGAPDTRSVPVIAQGGLHPRCARFTCAHCPGVPLWDRLSVPAAMWEELVAGAYPGGLIYPDPDWLERAYELSEGDDA